MGFYIGDTPLARFKDNMFEQFRGLGRRHSYGDTTRFESSNLKYIAKPLNSYNMLPFDNDHFALWSI